MVDEAARSIKAAEDETEEASEATEAGASTEPDAGYCVVSYLLFFKTKNHMAVNKHYKPTCVGITCEKYTFCIIYATVEDIMH